MNVFKLYWNIFKINFHRIISYISKNINTFINI